jgi:cell division protein FtsI (penicillin-binding protein 3)
MRQLMHEVVTQSNRKTLLLENCKVGAKTGTANLIINGQYTQGRNFVTLVTVFPLDKPSLMIILQMNDPKSVGLPPGVKYTTAGNVLGRYMRELIIRINKHRLI